MTTTSSISVASEAVKTEHVWSIRTDPDSLGNEWSVLIEYARERVVVLLIYSMNVISSFHNQRGRCDAVFHLFVVNVFQLSVRYYLHWP